MRPFKRLASRFTWKIRHGPLRGLRWIAASGSRFFLGRYHPWSVDALQRCVREGDVVYDVGAHVGYLTAAAALAAGSAGRVYAFEPFPLNLLYLRRHVEINGLENVRVIEAAVGDTSGSAAFQQGTGTGTGRLGEGGVLEVRTVALDDLVEAGELEPPDVIKVDVEGGEAGVLRGASRVIGRHRPHLIVSTHGEKPYRDCLQFLEAAGYRWEPLGRATGPGETELLARAKESAG